MFLDHLAISPLQEKNTPAGKSQVWVIANCIQMLSWESLCNGTF